MPFPAAAAEQDARPKRNTAANQIEDRHFVFLMIEHMLLNKDAESKDETAALGRIQRFTRVSHFSLRPLGLMGSLTVRGCQSVGLA